MSVTIAFPAHEMTTSLEGALALDIKMKASEARDVLRRSRYDQAPVVNEEGRLCGWVRTAHLGGRGYVESAICPLEKSAIRSRDTPVGDALQSVAATGLVFFAGPSGITDFAVVSDLDRHVVRCYLYVVLSEAEMLLADEAERVLSTAAIERLMRGRERARYEAACARGMETRAVEYLMFSAYSTVVDRIPALVAAFPGSLNELRSVLKEFNRLRNCVAHPSKSLTTEFLASELAGLAAKAEAFTIGLRNQRSDPAGSGRPELAALEVAQSAPGAQIS